MKKIGLILIVLCFLICCTSNFTYAKYVLDVVYPEVEIYSDYNHAYYVYNFKSTMRRNQYQEFVFEDFQLTNYDFDWEDYSPDISFKIEILDDNESTDKFWFEVDYVGEVQIIEDGEYMFEMSDLDDYYEFFLNIKLIENYELDEYSDYEKIHFRLTCYDTPYTGVLVDEYIELDMSLREFGLYDVFRDNIVDKNVPTLWKTSCTSGCAENTVGVYSASDDYGTSYYYRGNVNNNYVLFANKWWRVIRVNGDGSVRLIYQGIATNDQAPSTNSAATIGMSYYNTTATNNAYFGFKYTLGQPHGTTTNSTVFNTLNSWYNRNLTSYSAHIDTNVGFCNDRSSYSTNTGGVAEGTGIGTTVSYYGPYIRLYYNDNKENGEPSFMCPIEEDLFKVPVGLVTADEVIYAGLGIGSSGNGPKTNYLSLNLSASGGAYWTMSPGRFISSDNKASHFVVYNGYVSRHYVNQRLYVRPVINLKADTIFMYGDGTVDNPNVVMERGFVYE